MFISYSHKDPWIARQWVDLIEEAAEQLPTLMDEKSIGTADSIRYVEELKARAGGKN